GGILPLRRRLADAVQEGSGATQSEIFQAAVEMNVRVGRCRPKKREDRMLNRNSICIAAMVTALFVAGSATAAFDESKYPDWSGQWRRGEPGPPRYDPSKRGTGFGQEAPLTEEYKKFLEASMAD